MKSKISRLMIASALSGGGKTTVTTALLKIICNKGMSSASFKCGPDYIDTMFHKKANGKQGVNLDLFFQTEKDMKYLFCQNSKNADIAIIEGVMGYYDGMSMESAEASSYDIARKLSCPVILVVPARGMAFTVVSLIKGMADMFEDSNIQAVILNDVSEMTYKMLAPVIEKETGIKTAGYVPKLEKSFESRHLGLVTPIEETDADIEHNAEILSKTLDIEMLIGIAKKCEPVWYDNEDDKIKSDIKIAVAYDDAFCFFYKDNFDILRKMGAEILLFSPLKDKRLPKGTKGIILGGGYPEVYAKELADNTDMIDAIKNAAKNKIPIMAECGGFMYLHESIESDKKSLYKMCGVIPGIAYKTDRLVRFGYINIKEDNIKGHEFHYWNSSNNGNDRTAEKPSGKRSWRCIHKNENLYAGFPHLYYRSNPEFVKEFLDACRRVK